MAKNEKTEPEAKGSGGTVMLRDIEVDAYLAECVQITPELISEEFVRTPADLAYWNARYADGVRTHLKAKLHLDMVQRDGAKEVAEATARARIECREEIQSQNDKRVTESMVEAAVETHAPLLAAREKAASAEVQARFAFIEAEAQKAELYGFVDAIRTKKEMLISLGAQLRKEMEGDPTIREHASSGARLGRG